MNPETISDIVVRRIRDIPTRNQSSTIQASLSNLPAINQICWMQLHIYHLVSSHVLTCLIDRTVWAPPFVVAIDSSSFEWLLGGLLSMQLAPVISCTSHGQTWELGEKVAWAVWEHMNPFNCNLQLMVPAWLQRYKCVACRVQVTCRC